MVKNIITDKRRSGILAHITSLPSPYGVGDIGTSSLNFLDFLAQAGQGCWQFLPLNPTNEVFDNSPYMSTAAFAGSPLLISPDLLVENGFVTKQEIEAHPQFNVHSVDFSAVTAFKKGLLIKAFERFDTDQTAFRTFVISHPWVHEYGLFMALKDAYDSRGWDAWPAPLAKREPAALKKARKTYNREILYYQFEQFIFYSQWQKLKEKADKLGILLFADIPIYVGFDSVDVWANQQIFDLDPASCQPINVSGVPPDYFSKTGQRWGNPLYRWSSPYDDTQEALLDWWTARFQATFELADIARIDHFRGFESYWSIPAENKTALNGEWLKGPGTDFFFDIEKRLGSLNIVAEDLGIITKEVNELRDDLGFPGMKVIQFAFDGDPANAFLPQNFTTTNCVVYTGTHDNDTSLGWFLSDQVDEQNQVKIKQMANREMHDHFPINRDLIYLAHSSIAALSIIPLQDALGFGSDCRLNTPGVPKGNWGWRCAPEYLNSDISSYLYEVSTRSNRVVSDNKPE